MLFLLVISIVLIGIFVIPYVWAFIGISFLVKVFELKLKLIGEEK